ncbi:MAG: hypothetical protein U0Q22_12660 [Acidimicrobiales bacterium]
MTVLPLRPSAERGRLSYRVGREQTDRSEMILRDDSVVAFGRGAQCEVRIGHAPTRDDEMPRVAGWLIVAHGRVIVEAAPTPGADAAGTDAVEAASDLRQHEVRRALQLSYAGGPPMPIAPGSAVSPASNVFTVEVLGANRTWELDVVALNRYDDPVPSGHDEPRTNGVGVMLTDLQREVLLAYARPVLAGAVEPATHDQVAAHVCLSRSAVRRVLDRISDEFYNKRLWSPESADTRVRVVEAARHNQLLGPTAARL